MIDANESERVRIEERLRENWESVVSEVNAATIASGRSAGSVRIIAATKYVDAPTTVALVKVGCHDIGENRPQVLWEKHDFLRSSDGIGDSGIFDSLRWHMIGHLQRNKLRRTLSCRPMIHSVDSERIFDSIAEESSHQGFTTRVLLEVNISGELSKTGMPADEVTRILSKKRSDSIQISGLMAMAGLGAEGESAREQFAQTRELRDRLSRQFGIELSELSMGMSGDFREAIAEGASMVRIGSRLFEGV